MRYKIKSIVHVDGIDMTHTHEQEFDDSSNAFGRVAEYREYMHQTFPGAEWALLEAKQIKRRK